MPLRRGLCAADLLRTKAGIPNKTLNMQRLRILWSRDIKLSIDTYSELKAQDAKKLKRAKLRQRLSQLKTPPKPDVPCLPPTSDPTPSSPARPTPSLTTLSPSSHVNSVAAWTRSRPLLSQQSSRTQTNEPRSLSGLPEAIASLPSRTSSHKFTKRND